MFVKLKLKQKNQGGEGDFLTEKPPRVLTEIVPHIYLDANIIVDIIQGQRRASIHMIEEIKNRKWVCSTSAFSYMEVLDIIQENKFIYEKLSDGFPLKMIMRMRANRDLSDNNLEKIFNQVKNKFFIPYDFIEFYDLTEDGWGRALGICATTNIFAPDSLHLATAIEAGCDLLVTSDEFFSKTINELDTYVVSCLPEKFKDMLEELGFKE